MLAFEERGKSEFPEKNLSEQSREPTNSAHIWRRAESNPGHIGGRRALSPLRQPCSPPTLLPPNPAPPKIGILNVVYNTWEIRNDLTDRFNQHHRIEKFSLYLKRAGLSSRNSTPSKQSSYVVSASVCWYGNPMVDNFTCSVP